MTMKILPTTLLAGVASVAFAGTVAAHTLTLQLPGGATEQITYSGDVAPQVSILPAPVSPAADWALGPQSPFALMQQIAAQMDRDADVMMRQMQEIAAQPLAGPGQPIPIDMTRLPPGTQSYSFVSTLSPRGVCSQSTEIIAKGAGQKPQVITHRSGDCSAPSDGAAATVARDNSPATQPAQPHLRNYQTRFHQTQPADHPDYRSMFREASW
ncbi:MAG TPA: hypothetical protein VN728_05695 [Stellaceae bacterium]|jgi:hypothetical protein|nr:hypothetical protein [Stellaceae bacterium]